MKWSIDLHEFYKVVVFITLSSANPTVQVLAAIVDQKTERSCK